MQTMDESYRLVFRGEVLDNQHPAVVKKRLASALKLTDAQAEKLFSGSSVVVKQQADTKTAARYQGLFKQAGARLRVLPVVATPAVAATTSATDAPAAGKVENAKFALQPPQFAPAASEPAREILAPEFSLAQLGANLVEPRPVATYELEVDFELAEVGSLIPTLAKEVVVPVNMDELEFEVAEVGADIGDTAQEPAAVAPDVSHISLVD